MTTSNNDSLTAETVILGHSSKDEQFVPRAGKRISSWLSIRHAHGVGRGIALMMTFRGTLIPLSMDEAKRLRAWLDGVIP